jgi:hypothetical protein
MRFWMPALALFSSFALFQPAHAADDERITCSAYYLLLSVDGDHADISSKQASKAAYAFVRQVGDNPQTQGLLTKKFDELRQEMPGKMTAENVAAFRAVHDEHCKVLLKSAWCEAYKGLSANACVE